MDRNTLLYYEGVLSRDVNSLMEASVPGVEIPDPDFCRAINVQLEAIKSDVANIQHLLEG